MKGERPLVRAQPNAKERGRWVKCIEKSGSGGAG